jgi:hypothetical protein
MGRQNAYEVQPYKPIAHIRAPDLHLGHQANTFTRPGRRKPTESPTDVHLAHKASQTTFTRQGENGEDPEKRRLMAMPPEHNTQLSPQEAQQRNSKEPQAVHRSGQNKRARRDASSDNSEDEPNPEQR